MQIALEAYTSNLTTNSMSKLCCQLWWEGWSQVVVVVSLLVLNNVLRQGTHSRQDMLWTVPYKQHVAARQLSCWTQMWTHSTCCSSSNGCQHWWEAWSAGSQAITQLLLWCMSYVIIRHILIFFRNDIAFAIYVVKKYLNLSLTLSVRSSIIATPIKV